MTDIFFFYREEPFGFLSNFWREDEHIASWGAVYKYPTNEHYYQSQKANSHEVHDYIVQAPHARIAMVLGRQLEHNKYLKDKYMRPNWDQDKLDVMLIGLRAKFKNYYLRKMLLETGNAKLHENNPEDPFWGWGNSYGQDWLGKLLMIVREEILKDGGQTE